MSSPDRLPPAGARFTLAEQVYHRLSAAILSGAFTPGAKISEPALAREYGVSRGPLREALHRLQERRLITRSANQGPRVVQPSAESLAQLFLVREALEGMAARLAAAHATEDDVAVLRRSLLAEPPAQDHDFHAAVARCSRNPMLIELLCTELYPLLRLYRGVPAGVRPQTTRAAVEHDRIVTAIAEHEPDVAELLMRRHIAAARRRRETVLERGAPNQGS